MICGVVLAHLFSMQACSAFRLPNIDIQTRKVPFCFLGKVSPTVHVVYILYMYAVLQKHIGEVTGESRQRKITIQVNREATNYAIHAYI